MREKKKEYVWKKSHEKISEKESGAELLDIWHLYSNNKNITSENIEM